jgi:hypothetical protein
MLPDFDRADRIGESSGGYPESRAFAELLIDCEEERTLRAVLVGMLREAERSGPSQDSSASERGTGRRASRVVCLSKSLGKAYKGDEWGGAAMRDSIRMRTLLKCCPPR